MDPIVIAAIIAGLSALGNFVSQERTNRMNIDQSTHNRLWEQQMRDQENEYNDPLNVQAREHAAGWYRNAAGGSLGTTSFPSAQTNPVSNPMLNDPMSAAIQAFMSGATGLQNSASAGRTKSLLSLERQQMDAQISELRNSAQLLGLQGFEQSVVNRYADAMQAVSLQGKRLDLDLKIWQKNLLKQQFDYGEKSLYELLDRELRLKDSQISLNAMSLEEVVAHIESMMYQNAESASRTEVNKEEAGLLAAQQQTEGYKQENLAQQTAESQQATEGIKIDNEQARKVLQMYLQTFDDIVKQTAAQTKLSEKEVRWYFVNSVLHGAGSQISGVGKGLAGGLAAGALKRGVARTVVSGFAAVP